MSRSDAQRIQDIVVAARRASSITADGRDAFDADWRNVAAAERMLHIIGEAAAKLSDAALTEYPDVPWRLIRRMRNVITHEYHKVEPDMIWDTLVSSIPPLLDHLTSKSESEDGSLL